MTKGKRRVTIAREKAWFRGLARKQVTLAATLSHAVQGFCLDARVQDLGLGGARLELSGAKVEVGDEVALALVAPTLWDPIDLPARVAWQRAGADSTLVGLAFDGAKEPPLLLLFDLLASLGYGSP